MTAKIRELSARLRNLFQAGEMRLRYEDGRVQVQARHGMVAEKAEAFPYGFHARAKGGRALVLCLGGDAAGFEILPLLPGDGVMPPALNDGDVALYTAGGGWIALRDSGGVELSGRGAGGVVKAGELKAELAKMTARIDAVISALTDSPTVAQDGGAAHKAAIAAALGLIAGTEDFSGIESEEVLHGGGR